MPKRVLQGAVVSDSTDKTVRVVVKRRVSHPLYKKFMNKSKSYLAHDEKNEFKVGDFVEIQESKPISKKKSWVVVGKISSDEKVGE